MLRIKGATKWVIHTEGGGQKLPNLGVGHSATHPKFFGTGGGGLFKQKFKGTVKGVQRENRGEGGKIPHTKQKNLISPQLYITRGGRPPFPVAVLNCKSRINLKKY